MKKLIKSALIGKGTKVHTIRFGTASGLKMLIDPDGGSMRIMGLDETELMPYVKRFAKNTELFLDVGSSDGFYPLIFRKFNSVGHIYSVEADSSRAIHQAGNFKLNHFPVDKLNVIEKFVSDRDDDVHVKIDTLLAVRNKKVFLKIDIEGAELIALTGAIELLHNNSCYIIIETHSAQLEKDCDLFLQRLGYKTSILNHGWFRSFIPEKRNIEHNRWLTAEKVS